MSELGQIELLGGLIRKNKALHDALKKKDWAKVAFHYNGKGYKVNNYDTKMRQAYHEIKKKGSSP